MKVRTQLLLAGVPLAVALVVVGLFAVRSIGFLDRSSQAILAHNYRSVLAAQRIGAGSAPADRRLLDHRQPQATRHRRTLGELAARARAAVGPLARRELERCLAVE